MGSHNAHRKQSLGHFLLNLLECREIHGLEWLDRDRKLFKIPWYDKRVRNNEENVIVKQWEIYNNRYIEGNPESWTEWKQVFRGALNKSPSVKAITEMHQEKNTNLPFRVYQFADGIDILDPDSCLARKRSKKSPNNLQNRCAQEDLSQHGSVSLSPLNSPNEHHQGIPQVVLDELSNGNLSNPVCETYSDPEHGAQCTDLSHVQHFDRRVMNLVHNSDDVLMNSPEPVCTTVSRNSSLAPCRFQANNELGMLPAAVPHRVIHPTPPIIYSTTNENLMNGGSGGGFVKFQVYYLHHYKVLEGVIGNNGVRLFSKLKPETERRLNKVKSDGRQEIEIKGPEHYEQLELPVCSQYESYVSKYDYDNLQGILDSMERGVLLSYVNKKMFVHRLCRSQVYASLGKEGNVMIDRRSKSPFELFDMERFTNQLKQYYLDPKYTICPTPTLTLTFGTNPGREPLLHLELTVLEAENLLHRVIPTKSDILLSGFDSIDALLESFDLSMTLS